MKKLNIIMIILCMIIPLASASLGCFKQNDPVPIVTSLNTSSVVISVLLSPSPLSEILLRNATMEKYGYAFNYTFLNTSKLGTYSYGYCDAEGNCGYSNDFIITPTGFCQTTSQGLGSMSFIILMFGLTVLLGFLGFKFSESKLLWVLGIFFIFLALLFVVYDVFLGFQYYQNYTGEADGGMPQIIFYIFMMLLTAGLMVSMILLFRHWKDWARYIKRELKSKDTDDEFDKDVENF
jgi:hypothetical protein